MKQWMILLRKESVEMLRNYKWIWIPLVFAVVGLSQPVSTYYMPQIIENFGGLPEGAVIELPVPSAGVVMATVLDQFSQVGILVLVLSAMGAVSGERTLGTAAMVLAKPVSKFSFITSKITAHLLVTWIALLVGLAAAWYYTELLIGSVAWERVLSSYLVYGLWMSFVVTLTIMLSSLIRSTLVTAFLALGFTLLTSILASVLKELLFWSPSTLSAHAKNLLVSGEGNPDFFIAIITSIAIVFAMALLTPFLFNRQEV